MAAPPVPEQAAGLSVVIAKECQMTRPPLVVGTWEDSGGKEDNHLVYSKASWGAGRSHEGVNHQDRTALHEGA